MNSKSFFAELKRRNVYKVAVAYAIIGGLLIQVATQVFPFLEIPNWAIRLVILLTALGFPVALLVAWAFELTQWLQISFDHHDTGTLSLLTDLLLRGLRDDARYKKFPVELGLPTTS